MSLKYEPSSEPIMAIDVIAAMAEALGPLVQSVRTGMRGNREKVIY